MNRMQKQVEEFHVGMGLEWASTPELLDMRSKGRRLALMTEELGELKTALLKNDMIGTIDGLCDLLYVVYGTAVEMGVDLEPFFDEIHASNMTKTGGERRADGKQLKPDSYVPPDLDYVMWDEYSIEQEQWSNYNKIVADGLKLYERNRR